MREFVSVALMFIALTLVFAAIVWAILAIMLAIQYPDSAERHCVLIARQDVVFLSLREECV